MGTIVSSAYAGKHHLQVKNILFTPLAETFQFAGKEGIAFHGTSDPWAKTEDIVSGCKGLGLPLFITEDANHSLETGDVMVDLDNLRNVMAQVDSYITEKKILNTLAKENKKSLSTIYNAFKLIKIAKPVKLENIKEVIFLVDALNFGVVVFKDAISKSLFGGIL